MSVKAKMFWSEVLSPIIPPDGTCLEERVNIFLAGIPTKKVLDVSINAFPTTKYGMVKTFYATVIYED